MKIHRFIVKADISGERLLIRDPDLTHQIRTVLKLRIGERIALSDGFGREIIGSLANIDRSGIEVGVVERRETPDPKRKVTLYCAILKRENFEYAVEKAVETGVARIVPLLTMHTVKLGFNRERLAKIAKEAAEQSGRGTVPEIVEPMRFRQALKDAAANDANYFFDGNAEDAMRPKPLAATIGVWIGPEGGWDAAEAAAAEECGFSLCSLGKLVLRAETAATVAVYLAAR